MMTMVTFKVQRLYGTTAATQSLDGVRNLYGRMALISPADVYCWLTQPGRLREIPTLPDAVSVIRHLPFGNSFPGTKCTKCVAAGLCPDPL